MKWPSNFQYPLHLRVAVAFGVGWLLLFAPGLTAEAQIKAVSKFNRQGKVRSIKSGQITVQHGKGIRQIYKIQDSDEEALSLQGGKFIFNMPAKIRAHGTLAAPLLERGMIVQFETTINKFGRSKQKLNRIKVIQDDVDRFFVRLDRMPEGKEEVPCTVVGRVVRYENGNLLLHMPDSKYARKDRIKFKVEESATFDLDTENLNRVRIGDTVNFIRGVKLSTGDFVATEIDISLTARREAATISFHDQLEQKYSDLSDEPTAPREVVSDHFILYTDISERSSSILLAKLETMYELISRYYNGMRPREPIECYVVSDLDLWAGQIPPVGVAKIAQQAGVTASVTRGNRTKAVVFSCDKHGVVQHEAVHAFCSQTFGSTGPVWYSEGMAEVGQYWKPRELAVNIDPVVIDYLTFAEPRKMRDIVAAGQITGDSWKAYAWRWALCHLLAQNPNYSRRFKRLGINIMSGEGDSFDNAFGEVADYISFEYDQFVQNFGNGYRVDLCAWDWKTKPSILATTTERKKKQVKAQAGWQATGLKVQTGVTYDYIAQGQWNVVRDGPQLTADGDSDDNGRLIGLIMHGDFELMGPFNLGEKGEFTSPVEGHLYLRCDDLWTELSDNNGELTVYFRKQPKNGQDKTKK